MSKHTPGPWEIEGPYCVSATKRDPRANRPTRIARIYSDKLAMYVGEPEANARLISASPDLLAACEAMLARLDLEPVEAVFPCSAMRETIRAALAKAKGQPIGGGA